MTSKKQIAKTAKATKKIAAKDNSKKQPDNSATMKHVAPKYLPAPGILADCFRPGTVISHVFALAARANGLSRADLILLCNKDQKTLARIPATLRGGRDGRFRGYFWKLDESNNAYKISAFRLDPKHAAKLADAQADFTATKKAIFASALTPAKASTKKRKAA
jgi:hypothetical protein